MKSQRKGFSVILAIVVTAFLTIVSAGVLDLVIRELKTSGAYWRGTVAGAGAEGALEWALLKNKQHGAGFEDKVAFNVDKESLLLSGKKEFADVGRNDQVMEYEIFARSGAYLGTVYPHEFEVLPLFYDSGAAWKDMEGDAHSFEFNEGEMRDSVSVRMKDLAFSEGDEAGKPAELVWNVMGTRTATRDGEGRQISLDNGVAGVTDGIAGVGAFDSKSSERDGKATSKKVIPDMVGQKVDNFGYADETDPVRTSVDTAAPISWFLEDHGAKYLVVYNFNDKAVTYAVESDSVPLSLPETTIYASSTSGDFKQTLRFTDSRRALFSGLKYSLFSSR